MDYTTVSFAHIHFNDRRVNKEASPYPTFYPENVRLDEIIHLVLKRNY